MGCIGATPPLLRSQAQKLHEIGVRGFWHKIPLWIDEEKLEIPAGEIARSHIGDAPMLVDLLKGLLTDLEIGTVVADDAHDT